MKHKFWDRARFSFYFVSGFAIFLCSAIFVNLYGKERLQDGFVWLETKSLPTKEFPNLSRHTVVAFDDFLYVLGGSSEKLDVQSKDVYVGKINIGGLLDEWNKNKVLSNTIVYSPAAITQNGCIYLAGGLSGNASQSSLIFGQVVGSNQINWQRANIAGFPARYLHTVIISGQKLFALGGFNPNTGAPIAMVNYLNLSSDCKEPIDTWQSANPLDVPRSAPAAVIFEGRIYVIGGFEGGSSLAHISSSVSYATVQDTGLGSWTRLTSTLPISLAYHTAFVAAVERRIYVVGGLEKSGQLSSKVYSAYIENNGNLIGDRQTPNLWQEEPELELPVPLYRHASVLANNGSVYVVGGQTRNENNKDVNQAQVYYFPPLILTKSSDPPGPVHEGDIITYTISYANTSLITQTLTITDLLPFNVTLIPDSISPPAEHKGSTLVWHLGDRPPGATGQVSFQVKVPLLPSPFSQRTLAAEMASASGTPIDVMLHPVSCDTTRFWANGVTLQEAEPKQRAIQAQFPPRTSSAEIWLLMKGEQNPPPLVAGQPAQLIKTSHNSITGASIWAASISPTIAASGRVTVVTDEPGRLNAIFLFDKDTPPFDQTALDDLYRTVRTYTYTLDIPSVATQTIDVILPFMDITELNDDLKFDPRHTHITVQFNAQSRTISTNWPNLGNGLFMAHFSFDIGPLAGVITATKQLNVAVDTEDSIYTLGPRICQPVYVENTAWLCSSQAGCVADTTKNIPLNMAYPYSLYVPVILKLSP